MGILIKVIYPIGIEKRGSSFNAMNFISFVKKEFSKVRPILACDACYKGLPTK
jgi:hypothetical protein